MELENIVANTVYIKARAGEYLDAHLFSFALFYHKWTKLETWKSSISTLAELARCSQVCRSAAASSHLKSRFSKTSFFSPLFCLEFESVDYTDSCSFTFNQLIRIENWAFKNEDMKSTFFGHLVFVTRVADRFIVLEDLLICSFEMPDSILLGAQRVKRLLKMFQVYFSFICEHDKSKMSC